MPCKDAVLGARQKLCTREERIIMKEIKIKVYTIDELSEDARQTALDEMDPDIVFCDGWWKPTYEFYKEKLAEVGLSAEFNFRGFYSQGDGAGTYNVDAENMEELLDALGITFPHKGLRDLFLEYAYVKSSMRGCCYYFRDDEVDVCADVWFENRPRINRLIDEKCHELEVKIDRFLDDIKAKLYQDLEEEYEYLASDEQKLELSRANDWTYREDGTFFAA